LVKRVNYEGEKGIIHPLFIFFFEYLYNFILIYPIKEIFFFPSQNGVSLTGFDIAFPLCFFKTLHRKRYFQKIWQE